MSQTNLPFKIGQVIETKSFLKGYRGAWFCKCKILNIFTKNGKLIYRMKYVDYPDEKIHEIKAFEKPKGSTKYHLMARPSYPPLYHESDIHKIKSDLETLVVVHGSWKVGDLVDWFKDGCYWSGTILELKDNETVQIELLPIPIGEGSLYEALSKELRPSLDWSLEDGWKVPFSMDGQGRQCAKLIKPNVEDEEILDCFKIGKEETVKDMHQAEVHGGLKLNIMESDMIEAAVLDLEELIARIEWLKDKLIPSIGEGENLYWKYEDYLPSSRFHFEDDLLVASMMDTLYCP